MAGPPQARASPRPAPANPGTHLRGSTDRGPRDRAHRVKGSQGGTGLAGEKAGGHSGQRGQQPMGFPGSKCPEVSSGASWRSGRKAARMPAVSMLASTGSPGTPSSGAGPRARAGGPQGGPPAGGRHAGTVVPAAVHRPRDTCARQVPGNHGSAPQVSEGLWVTVSHGSFASCGASRRGGCRGLGEALCFLSNSPSARNCSKPSRSEEHFGGRALTSGGWGVRQEASGGPRERVGPGGLCTLLGALEMTDRNPGLFPRGAPSPSGPACSRWPRRGPRSGPGSTGPARPHPSAPRWPGGSPPGSSCGGV